MKFSIDDKEICCISDMQEKIICYCISEKQVFNDMCRRVNWLVDSVYDSSLDQLMKNWIPKMSERYDSLPTNQDKLIDLIFSQPDYKPKG